MTNYNVYSIFSSADGSATKEKTVRLVSTIAMQCLTTLASKYHDDDSDDDNNCDNDDDINNDNNVDDGIKVWERSMSAAKDWKSKKQDSGEWEHEKRGTSFFSQKNNQQWGASTKDCGGRGPIRRQLISIGVLF